MTDQEKQDMLMYIFESIKYMGEGDKNFIMGYAAGVIASHSGPEARQTA